MFNDKSLSLLLKTNSENLSLLARQINSKYAQLWQGCFKSWFVHDEHYLGTLARYIEQNPIKANMTK